MPYLTEPDAIQGAIATLSQATTLWLDTEVADFKTKNPRLSLIQALGGGNDSTPDAVLILDVLDQPDIVEQFIAVIMENPAIAKVFHNAAYDQKYLGQQRVQNVHCTLKMAKAIPQHLLPIEKHDLKTLTEYFAIAPNVDKTEQGSDWGQRPLSEAQCYYAALDVVYLAQLHTHLLPLYQRSNPDPATDDIEALILRYQQIKPQWDALNAEVKHLEQRLKAAMPEQGITQYSGVELKTSQRKKYKVPFQTLAQLLQTQAIDWDFPVVLTKPMQKTLGAQMHNLPIEEEVTTTKTLKTQLLPEDELPF